jgi:cytoskeletal protein CcmA (bactofilin family)
MLPLPRARATLLAVIATFLLAGPVAAGDFRGDDSVTVGADEAVDDDLYVGAGTVSIAGTVNGDATVAGGTVSVRGTVNGSLNVAGGTVDVLGDVTGAVRVSGGTVSIAGSVGRDVVLFGGTATIESGAEIGGDLAGATGTLTVGGTVGGDLLAGAGTIEIIGTVNGSVDVGVGMLTLAPSAVVGGDLTYTSEEEATIADGAQIGGEVERREPEAVDDGGPTIADNPVVSYLGLLLGMLLLGWGLLAVRPRLALGSAEALRTAPLVVLGIGFGALIGQFVLFGLLILVGALVAALVGPLGGAFFLAAIVLLLLIVLLILLSAVPLAMAIGRAVLPNASSYLAYLAGAAILCLVLIVAGYVPVLGGVLFLLVWILGLGAFIVYSWRTRSEPYVIVTPPAAPEGAPPSPTAA